MQGRVREWRWECGEMEKRVREVRSEEVRLRGALEQREREAIAHLREVSWIEVWFGCYQVQRLDMLYMSMFGCRKVSVIQ